MKTEFEAKVLEIEPKIIKETLEALGATALGTTLQWRYVFDIVPGDSSQWLRLRNERQGITLTHKRIESSEIDGTQETAALLDSTEDLVKVMESVGLDAEEFQNFWLNLETKDRTHEQLLKYLASVSITPKSYQENKRTSFELEECTVEIDEWPLIPTYLEIEASSEHDVLRMADKLGFSPEQLTSVNTVQVYKKYGLDIADFPRLTFDIDKKGVNRVA